MARKSNRVRIYKPPKSRSGWKPSRKGKKQKRKQVVLESKMIQRHTTGQISNEISPSWTQTQSVRDKPSESRDADSPDGLYERLTENGLSLKRFYQWFLIHNVFIMQELILMTATWEAISRCWWHALVTRHQSSSPTLNEFEIHVDHMKRQPFRCWWWNSWTFSIRNAVFFTTR